MARNRFNEGAGPSQRQLRVAELIRRQLSDVLNRGEIHDPELNRLSITVGEVRVSPDLKVATAYVAATRRQRDRHERSTCSTAMPAKYAALSARG